MTAAARITTYRPAPGVLVAALLRAAAGAAPADSATVLLFQRPEPEADTFWTDERKADLERLFLVEGLSFALIAKQMGVTRNRVMGKAYRMGLERAEPARVIERMTGRVVPLRAKKTSARPPRVAFEVTEARMLADAGPALGVTLLHVTGCRWPVGYRDGEHTFCNGRRIGLTYCCDHARQAVAG